MIDDHLCMTSEIVEVEALLESIPEGNVIERKSLESRLEYLKGVLATMRQREEKVHEAVNCECNGVKSMMPENGGAYRGVLRIYERYWRAYGGFAALIRSPYLHAALVTTLICFKVWLSPGWWTMATSILPDVTGSAFIIALALFTSVGDVEFKKFLMDPDEDDEEATTAYIKLCATFVHFIFVQTVALLFAVIVKAMYFPWVNAPEFFKAVLPWLNGTAGFIGFSLFVYSMMGVLAVTMNIFRIASIHQAYHQINIDSQG
jgi:hypothetical protein